MTAEDIIEALGLEQHQEGGWFKRTYISSFSAVDEGQGASAAETDKAALSASHVSTVPGSQVDEGQGAGAAETIKKRSTASAIYYLLRAGEESRWHRIDADEMYHYYAGAPLALEFGPTPETAERHFLGPDILAGQRPQILCPAYQWQRAHSLATNEEGWTLVGATVSPEFQFEGWELLEG